MTDSIFSFFGLRENPFKINPDPRFLFSTDESRASADELVYAVRNRKGLILLTGEVGTGKTMLIRRLLDWLAEEKMPTALIFNSRIRPEHLLDFILHDFGVPCDSAIKSDKLMALNRWLLDRYRSGQTPVLIVDEAQGLDPETLEEVRLLMNFETPRDKLLQIVLAGQPELETKLKRHELRQLRQRITIRSRTSPLTAEQTTNYIAHRLGVAGASGQQIFDADAAAAVHAHAHGIPRVINVLCEHAMVNACADGTRTVSRHAVDQAASECHLDRADSVARILQTGSYSAAELADEIKSVLAAVSSRFPQYAQPRSQSHGAQQERPSTMATGLTSTYAAPHFGPFERTFPNAHATSSPDGADAILSPLGSAQAMEAPRAMAAGVHSTGAAASAAAAARVNPQAHPIETIPLSTQYVMQPADLISAPETEPQDVDVRAMQGSAAQSESGSDAFEQTNTGAPGPTPSATRRTQRAPESFAELLGLWRQTFVRDCRASYRNIHRQMRSFEMHYWNPTKRGLRREFRQAETRIVRFLSDPQWGRSWSTLTGATERHWRAAKAATLSRLDRRANAEDERAAGSEKAGLQKMYAQAVNSLRRWLRGPISTDRKASLRHH